VAVPRSPDETPEYSITGAPEGEGDATGAVLGPAAVVETHISLLFFVGDRVYKLRKPVEFGFLDFRQRPAREADCQREVLLNQRLAPDVYLGVADIVIDGVPVDHVVVMRRMPEGRRLATLARDGRVLDNWLRQIAEVLVSFHRSASRSPEISAAGTGTALRAGWGANFAEADPFIGPILDPEIEGEIRSLARCWIAGRERLLESRIVSGCVCDEHGDLQAEDIFCLEDGPRILDCVEFSDELRYGDVIADVAFLAMDLERLGFTEAADEFLACYQEISDDRFPASLLHHYMASRAYIRAKVACLRSAQGSDGSVVEARRLQALALTHLRAARVRLVLVGGLPGSGKSTIAAGLARALPMTALRTDAIRVEKGADRDLNLAYGQGRYSSAAKSSVYEEMLRGARRLLESGESVILDASWHDASWRDAARRLAEDTSSHLVELCCVADHREAAARINRRLREREDVSEATPQVLVDARDNNTDVISWRDATSSTQTPSW
jgi:uncharacterized protein